LTGLTALINYLEIGTPCLARLIDVIAEVCRSLTDFAFLMSREQDRCIAHANNSENACSVMAATADIQIMP
jgi:hypothetical protein